MRKSKTGLEIVYVFMCVFPRWGKKYGTKQVAAASAEYEGELLFCGLSRGQSNFSNAFLSKNNTRTLPQPKASKSKADIAHFHPMLSPPSHKVHLYRCICIFLMKGWLYVYRPWMFIQKFKRGLKFVERNLNSIFVYRPQLTANWAAESVRGEWVCTSSFVLLVKI